MHTALISNWSECLSTIVSGTTLRILNTPAVMARRQRQFVACGKNRPRYNVSRNSTQHSPTVEDMEDGICQTFNIPVDTLRMEMTHILSQGVLVLPDVYKTSAVPKVHAVRGTLQDVVIGSKGSSTLFHIDSPLPLPSTVLVIKGHKEVMGWPYTQESSHGLPNYGETQGCMPLELWMELRRSAKHKEGQHVEVPALHVHAVYNHTFCISVNTTSEKSACLSDMPYVINELATLVKVSADERMGRFVEPKPSTLGPALEKRFNEAVQTLQPAVGTAARASQLNREERRAEFLWAAEAEFSLLYLEECRSIAGVKICGFNNKDVAGKISAVRKAVGLKGVHSGKKRKAGDASDE
eukprot:jgi/Botrbrau1/11838/Bobra.0175s0003.1